jgi:hypothetical protein
MELSLSSFQLRSEEEEYKERIKRKEVVKNGLNKNLSVAYDSSNGLSHVPFKLWFIIFVSTLHSSIFFAVIYVVCKYISRFTSMDVKHFAMVKQRGETILIALHVVPFL